MEAEAAMTAPEGKNVNILPSEGSLSTTQPEEIPRSEDIGYRKVYKALGFSKAYNFPLCKSMQIISLAQDPVMKVESLHDLRST